MTSSGTPLDRLFVEGEDDEMAGDYTIQSEDESGYLIKFQEVETVPSATQQYQIIRLEWHKDRNHYISMYETRVDGLPCHIATIQSCYDNALDMPNTHQGMLWLGKSPDSEIPDSDQDEIFQWYMHELRQDCMLKVWKIHHTIEKIPDLKTDHDLRKRIMHLLREVIT